MTFKDHLNDLRSSPPVILLPAIEGTTFWSLLIPTFKRNIQAWYIKFHIMFLSNSCLLLRTELLDVKNILRDNQLPYYSPNLYYISKDQSS